MGVNKSKESAIESVCLANKPVRVLFSHLCERTEKCLQQQGFITTQVLRGILAAIDDKLTDSDLDAAIEEIDEDGSGTVDFDGKTAFIRSRTAQNASYPAEFKEMMNG